MFHIYGRCLRKLYVTIASRLNQGGAVLNTYLILILFIYLFKEGVEYVVEYLNLRHMKEAGLSVPSEFQGKMDEELMKKTTEYETEKTRFSFIS